MGRIWLIDTAGLTVADNSDSCSFSSLLLELLLPRTRLEFFSRSLASRSCWRSCRRARNGFGRWTPRLEMMTGLVGEEAASVAEAVAESRAADEGDIALLGLLLLATPEASGEEEMKLPPVMK